MKFRFTKLKTSSSAIIAVLIGFFAYWFSRYRTYIPGPAPLGESIFVSIIVAIICFIVIYLIISLFQKNNT